METLHNDRAALEAIVPGVTEAYDSLMADNGLGIYTSNGAFYNHTFFGRDASMSARFVTDFDHETAFRVITGLMRFQGRAPHSVTQEAPGRIHHEWRDFHAWHGRFGDKVMLWLVGHFWGMRRGVLKTYFSADSTAEYIRLINKYCYHIDPSLLERTVEVRGERVTVASSLEQAADWLVQQVDERGRFMTQRAKHSLPFQTFQDSVTAYAWRDGVVANYRQPHSFVEVQAFAADALDDASRLLSGVSHKAAEYKTVSHTMRQTLLREYWDSEYDFFTSLLSERGGTLRPLDVPNITAGWTLNTSWWEEIPEHERAAKIAAVVNRLFSDEFLTDVGLRTRSKYAKEPLDGTIDYHGSQTVWPMFNFMVIGGLRRHRLFRLARQLENRLVNGANAIGQFPEFLIVDKDSDRLQRPQRLRRLPQLTAQMIPEKNIAFSVVPLLTIARSIEVEVVVQSEPWQQQLEDEVFSRIAAVPLLAPREAAAVLAPRDVYLRRSSALLRSVRRMRLREVRR